jgi:hypothetical protein
MREIPISLDDNVASIGHYEFMTLIDGGFGIGLSKTINYNLKNHCLLFLRTVLKIYGAEADEISIGYTYYSLYLMLVELVSETDEETVEALIKLHITL